MDILASTAAPLARHHLDLPELADRWRHVQAVAQRATNMAPALDPDDRDLFVAAAWLHDLGYAAALVDTGMHALDGARHLLASGHPPRLAALVAHHTGARFEAAQRGLAAELEAFPLEISPVSDALTTADLTTGPQGQPMGFDERIDEILRRYPPDSHVHQAVRLARPVLAEQVRRTTERLAGPPR